MALASLWEKPTSRKAFSKSRMVLMDLIEVLKRYSAVFDISGIDEQIGSLEKMWKESQ